MHDRAAVADELACEDLSSAEALACGLGDRAGDLDVALAWAERMADLAPLTVAYNKQVLNSLTEPDSSEAELLIAFEGCWASDDLVEGRRARDEKRTPQFRGI